MKLGDQRPFLADVKVHLGACRLLMVPEKRRQGRVTVGAIDTQEDSGNCPRKPLTRIGDFYHKLCRKQAAGYQWGNFLMAYMTGSLAVDMVAVMVLNVDECIDEHYDRSRSKYAMVRFQLGNARENVSLVVCRGEQGRARDTLASFSPNLELRSSVFL